MIRSLAIVLLFLVGQRTIAQSEQLSDVLSIFGSVRDYDSKRAIREGIIYVSIGDSIVSTYSIKQGKYSFTLPLGSEYKLCYIAPGYFKKIFIFDLRNIPPTESKNGFEICLDLSLKTEFQGFSQEILDMPCSKCAYNIESRDIEFDKVYIAERHALYDAEMERLKKIKR